MRILVTGATGALGSTLVPVLRSKGYQIRVLARQSRVEVRGAEVVQGDVRDAQSLRCAVKHTDVVIHLAGVTHASDPQVYYEVNTRGTQQLVDACKSQGVKRFLLISSRTASNEGGAYARSKLMAERTLVGSPFDWVILRVAEVYGGNTGEAISTLVKAVKVLPVVPVLRARLPPLCPVHIDDAVQAISAAIEKGKPKSIYLLAGPEALTFAAVARTIARVLGVSRVFLPLPLPLVRVCFALAPLFTHAVVRDQLPRFLCEKPIDISRTVEDLNFHPRTFSEGIRNLLHRSV